MTNTSQFEVATFDSLDSAMAAVDRHIECDRAFDVAMNKFAIKAREASDRTWQDNCKFDY